jgi:hypothetical protein
MDYTASLRVRFQGGIAAGSDLSGHLWHSIGLGGRCRGPETRGFLLKFSL